MSVTSGYTLVLQCDSGKHGDWDIPREEYEDESRRVCWAAAKAGGWVVRRGVVTCPKCQQDKMVKTSLNGGTKVHPLSEQAKDVLRRTKTETVPAYTVNPGIRDILTRHGYVRITQRIHMRADGPVYVNCLVWVADPPTEKP